MNQNKFKADPMVREFPIPYSQTVEIVTKAGQQRFTIPNAEYLRDKVIIGAFIRQQNDAGSRKSKNGLALIANTTLDCAFISFQVNSKRVVDEHPLSHFAVETGAPGDYVQLLLREGFDPTESYIRFTDASTVADNRAVEITFIFLLKEEEACDV